MFSVRIVTTDHYQGAPVQGLDVCRSDFGQCKVFRVPVIRVFGATPAGQKTCMHVHGVFPYVYVPYDGTLPLERYTRQFACSANKALNVALGRASSNQQHVFRITLVSGIPFYGYREEEQTFLKIYLYNPTMTKKLADLLLGGAVLNKVFQPHESHIPYLLQMFIDYNLYGMNMLHVAALKFRQPAVEDSGHQEQSDRLSRRVSLSNNDTLMLGSLDDDDGTSPGINDTQRIWDIDDIPQELLMEREVAERQSSCELEVDVVAADILNRLEVGDTVGTNPGLKALWEEEQQRRRERGEPEEIEMPSSPDRENVGWTRGEAVLQERLRQIISDLQPHINDDINDSASSGSDDILVPSSQVICHTSSAEPPDSLSQDAVLLDREDGEGEEGKEDEERDEGVEPIISEESIHQVVASSQSFRQDMTDDLDSQDQSLALILASLADSQSPVCSQSVLEEQDSILSQRPQPGNDAECEQEDTESQEMSQCIQQERPTDVEGMESSWNSSQWLDVDSASRRDSRNEESFIPQLDGPIDEKSDIDTIQQPRKRLGMRGSTISSRRCVRPSTHVTSLFSFVATTVSGMHTSFKASHAVESFPPPRVPSKRSSGIVIDLRSPPPVQIHGNKERIAKRVNSWKHKKKKDHALTESVEAAVDALSPLCEDTDVHRPTLVIKFKQVATTGDSMKQRLRHVKTWTSTIKNADTPTSISDTQINGAVDGFVGRKEGAVSKEVRRHSDGNENAGVPIGIGTRGGDVVENGHGVKEKVGMPAKKARSFSESAAPTKYDNIFQQMSTIIPEARMSEPALRGDANRDSFNSELDTSCDLFDSDHEMNADDDVPLASLRSKCDVGNASGGVNTEAHRNHLRNDAHSPLGNGECSTVDDVPPCITESNSRRSSTRRSVSRSSSVSQNDEPVIEAQKSLQRDNACNDDVTTDDAASNAMPYLESNRPTSPDVDRSLPHLEPSSEASFRSPTEMPILIDETQTNDLDALDLFGQWRPNASDDEMELVSEAGLKPSELVPEVGRKPSELVPEVAGKPLEFVPEVGRKPSTMREAGTTISRGGCRVKLPSSGSGTTRNDLAPRPDGQVEVSNNTISETSGRTRTGCRVKLPRRTSESDRPLVTRVKSTVRMLFPRPACPPGAPNLTALPETSSVLETSCSSDATSMQKPTAKQNPSPVFLADMKLKLSLKKKKRKRNTLPAGDTIHERDNWGVDSPAVNYSSYVMFEDEVKLPMEGSDDCVSDPAETCKPAPKSPLTTSEVAATDVILAPNQNAAYRSLIEGKIIKKKKSRLSLQRKSLSDGSLHGRKMVTFSAVPPITNYAGGRRVTCDHLVNGQVLLTRKHFKEYDLKKVGSETLLLQCLGGEDVAELKVQIQQEEAHRRKEKRSSPTIGFDVSDAHDTSVDSDDEPLLKYVATPDLSTGIEANSESVDLGVGGDSEPVDLGAGGDSRSKFGVVSLFKSAAASDVHNREVVAVRTGEVFRKHCKVVLKAKAKRHPNNSSKSKHSGREATGHKKTQDNSTLSLPDTPHKSRHAKDSQSKTKEAKLKPSKRKHHHHRRVTSGHQKKGSDKDESKTVHVTDDVKTFNTVVDIHEGSSNFLVDHVVCGPRVAVDEDASTSKETSDPVMDHSVDDPTDAMDKESDTCKGNNDPLIDHSADSMETVDKDIDTCKTNSDSIVDHVVDDPSEAIDEDTCKGISDPLMDHLVDHPTVAVDEDIESCEGIDNSLMDRAIDDPAKAVHVVVSLPDKPDIHRSRHASDSTSKTKEAKHKLSKRKHHHSSVKSGHHKKGSDKHESKSKHVTNESKMVTTIADIHGLSKNVTDVSKTVADIHKESSDHMVDHSVVDPSEAMNKDIDTCKMRSDSIVDHVVNDPSEAIDEDTCKGISDPLVDHVVDPTETIDEGVDTCKESSNTIMDHVVDGPTEAIYEDADVCKEKSNSRGEHSLDHPTVAVDEDIESCEGIDNSLMDRAIDDPAKAVNVVVSLPDKPDNHKSRHASDSRSKTKEAKHKLSKRKHHHSSVKSGHHKKGSDKHESKSKHVTDDVKIMHSAVDIHEGSKNVANVVKTVGDIHKESNDPLVDRVVDGPAETVNKDAGTSKESSDPMTDHSVDDPTKAMSLADKSHIHKSRHAKDSRSRTKDAKLKLSKSKYHHHRRVSSEHLKKGSDKHEGKSKHMTDVSKTMTSVVDIHKGSTNSPIDDAVTEPTWAVHKDIDICKVSSNPLVDHVVDDPTKAIYEDADICKEKSTSHVDYAVDDPKEAVDKDIDTCKESRDPITGHTTEAVDDPTVDEDADNCKESSNSPVDHSIGDPMEAVYGDVDSIPLVDHEVDDIAVAVGEDADTSKDSGDPTVDHSVDDPTEAVDDDAGTSRESSDLFVDHSVDDPAKALDKDIDICKESINSLMDRTIDDPAEVVVEDAESDPLVDHSVHDLAETVDEDIDACEEGNDPLVDHSVDDSSVAVDENIDTCKENNDPLMDHSVDDPANAVDENTNTRCDTLTSTISLVDYAIEEDYSSVIEYRTGSRTSEHANEHVCADQLARAAWTDQVKFARDLAKDNELAAKVTSVTVAPRRSMQDSHIKGDLSQPVSSPSEASNEPQRSVHETVQAADSKRKEDVTNCTVELEIIRLNQFLEDIIPEAYIKTNVTGTPSDQPQSKPAEPYPAVKEALALIHRRRQEASLPGPTATSLVHLEEAAASCRDALGERPTTSCAESRHDRKGTSESRDSPQRKRKHSSSYVDDDDRRTGRGDMRERSGSGSGHRSGSSRRGESSHRSESDHRSEKRHRSEGGRGSESSYRSEKDSRYETSRRSGSDHRSGNSHRSENDYRSGRDHRSGSSHRSEKERRSESSRRSDTSSHRSGTSSHRSDSSSHRSRSDHSSESSHRSDTSSHRSESISGSQNYNKSGSRLKTVPESPTCGQHRSNSSARNDNSTERNDRVRLEEPVESSSCRQQGYVGQTKKHKLPEDIFLPGVSTMNTHDICMLPSSLPSMPPLVREVSPENDRSNSARSPLRLTAELSPPKLTAQPWHLIEIDKTGVVGRNGRSKKKRHKSEDKLFSSGRTVGDGSTDDRRRVGNGCPDGTKRSRPEDRNDDNRCRTGENCKSGNKKRIASDNDNARMQDRSGHSVVDSDDDLFSLSSRQRLSGQSIQRERNFQLSDTNSDNVQELVSEVGLNPDDEHRRDKSRVLQDYSDRPLTKKSRDSRYCRDGGGDDSPNSSSGKPANNNRGSDRGHHTDSRVSHNRHRTTGRRSSHHSDSEHSADDSRPEGAFRQSRGVIITPVVAPPTRETVTVDVGRLSGPQLKEPFCSNPSDVPERPRQIGGRTLRVKSSLVSDLPEFQSSFRGLRSWHTAIVSGESPLNSSFDLAAEIENNPQLLAATIGDDKVVLTPCVLPPSLQFVQHWLTTKGVGEEKMTHEVKGQVDVHVPCQTDHVFTEKPSTCETTTQVPGSSTKRIGGIATSAQPASSGQTRTSFLTKHGSARELSAASQPLVADASDCIISLPPDDLAISTADQVVASTPLRKPSLVYEDSPTCTPIAKVLSQSQGDIDCTPKAPPERRTDARRRRLQLKPMSTETGKRAPDVSMQIKKQFSSSHLQKAATSQIEGPTLTNSFGFKFSLHDLKAAKAVHEFQYITVMSCELHIETRGDRRPDPEFDSICAIFYAITNDVPKEKGPRELNGVIVLDPESSRQLKQSTLGQTQRFDPDKPSTSKAANEREAKLSAAGSQPASAKDKTFQTLLERSGVTDTNVTYAENEAELLDKLVELVHRWDPDILVGYEIQMLSWGYILNRASKLNIKLCPRLSRLPGNERENTYSAEKDEYGADHMSEIHIAGRITLNLWRVLRHQVSLNGYTFENVAFHVLHRRIPLYSLDALTAWFRHRTHLYRWRTIEHYMIRARGSLQIMEELDVVGQTSEFARVIGIDFYSVLSRGSQYRIESMMLRIAKPLNFIPVSPSVHQRAHMRAPECIPLNMEPESTFYTDPVIVLDFQSMYPSIMIAYNYCFSTCLGQLEHLAKAQNGAFDFGCTSLSVPPSLLKRMENDITVSPVGVAFVKRGIRKGVLPSMLEEILQTRLMVKASMKKHKGNKTLERLLHARQLSLKYIANFTYGYTAAGFSGRMPSIEVGDSVVSKGRETLERAIELVETTPKWNGRVVYGDTDSMFIVLKGRTKSEAFDIGYEIADAVTALNPKPVKLKFEKVYLPCILQTKKRYVGFMYETRDQKEPVFDAKGIETVRRDNCPAVAKVLERSIKQLFTTSDVSLVKAYVQTQCRKLLEGRVSVQDCIFAKEYRGLTGYKPTACVPAREITRRLMSKDRQAEPRVGERVPYVIVHGTPGLPLIQLVRQPQELLRDPELRLNGVYYVTKQVLPPLARIFSLIGVDVFSWYAQLPKTVRVMPPVYFSEQNKKGTISQYFTSLSCPVCEEVTNRGMCDRCRRDPQRKAVVLGNRIRHSERALLQLSQICAACTLMVDDSQPCVSLDCPVLYRRHRASGHFNQVQHLEQLKTKLLQF